jgi:hypothetical protein
MKHFRPGLGKHIGHGHFVINGNRSFEDWPSIHVSVRPRFRVSFSQSLKLPGVRLVLGGDVYPVRRGHFAVEDSFLRGSFERRGREIQWSRAWDFPTAAFGVPVATPAAAEGVLRSGAVGGDRRNPLLDRLVAATSLKLRLRLGVNVDSGRLSARLTFRNNILSTSTTTFVPTRIDAETNFPVLSTQPLPVICRFRLPAVLQFSRHITLLGEAR